MLKDQIFLGYLQNKIYVQTHNNIGMYTYRTLAGGGGAAI